VPLLGFPLDCNDCIALLLGTLSRDPLRRQFILYGPPLSLRSTSCIFAGKALMGQLGLQILNGCACFLQQLYCVLARRDLLTQTLLRRFQLIRAGTLMMVSVHDCDRDLPVANKAATLWR